MVRIEDLISKVVEVPILKDRFTIVIVDDLSILRELHEIDIRSGEFDACVYRTHSSGELIAVFELENATPGIVLHESIHLVNYILSSKGIKLDSNNDEFQAYFTQWVFEQIDDFLKSIVKK